MHQSNTKSESAPITGSDCILNIGSSSRGQRDNARTARSHAPQSYDWFKLIYPSGAKQC